MNPWRRARRRDRGPDMRFLPLLVAVLLAPRAMAVPASWEPRGPGGGGALFAPSFSPHAPDELFVACDMTELFRTTDLGLSWTQAHFREFQGNTDSKVWFTPDRRVLYAIDHSTIALADLR